MTHCLQENSVPKGRSLCVCVGKGIKNNQEKRQSFVCCRRKMGGVVPAGESNEELVDNLIEAEYITKPRVEEVFRKVDRGEYIADEGSEEERQEAYTDSAWRKGTLHLSAPCIYTKALEALDIQPGCSFLNIGSGTGYFSTMAAILIGSGGTNHGVEIYRENVEYAKKKLEEFKTNSVWYDPVQFCDPYFCVGNGLLLSDGNRKYDKIYCGAACTEEVSQMHLKSLLEVGGTLVMPTQSELVAVTRVSEDEWSTDIVLSSVAFSPLILPSGEKRSDISTFTIDAEIPALKDLCKRKTLRSLTRVRYETIDHLPLPTPMKTYLKGGRDWTQPSPPLKKMCPFKREKFPEELSEEEDMACGMDQSPRRRRNRGGDFQVRNNRGQRMIICSLSNGITVQIPFPPGEDDDSMDEREGNDGENPMRPPPYQQLDMDEHHGDKEPSSGVDDKRPKKKKRSLLKFRSQSKEGSGSDGEEREECSGHSKEQESQSKAPKKEGFLRKLFKRSSSTKQDESKYEELPDTPSHHDDTPSHQEDTPIYHDDTPTHEEDTPTTYDDLDKSDRIYEDDK